MQIAEVLTTVTTAAPNYNLVNLSIVTDDLAITDNKLNRYLNSTITRASDAISKWCNRRFQVEGLTDTFYSARRETTRQRLRTDEVLQLTRWPIITVTSVIEIEADDTQNVLVLGTNYLIRPQNGQLVKIHSDTGFPSRWRAPQTIVTYVAGYGPNAERGGGASSYSTTIPGSPTFATVPPNGALGLVDLGVNYTGGAALTLVASSPTIGQYAVNTATGTYTNSGLESGRAITINYAYTVIPSDLQEATSRMVRDRYQARGRDDRLISESIPGVADRRWWSPTVQGLLPPDIEELVLPYRVPVVA